MDPIDSLSRVERRLLRVTGDRGVGPFALVVTAASVALSVAVTGLAFLLAGLERGDAIVAFSIAVAVPALVAPSVAVFLGRILHALGRASSELHHLARTDALTGVLNRRAFAEEAGALLARRPADIVVVAMFDLDRFKEVNDRHGHATGDRALRHMADNLADAAGEDGAVGRLGGDEFAVVVAVGASERAALTRRLERACDLDEAVPGLRASFGSLDATGVVTLAEALRRADHELYAAKRAFAPEPLPVV